MTGACGIFAVWGAALEPIATAGVGAAAGAAVSGFACTDIGNGFSCSKYENTSISHLS